MRVKASNFQERATKLQWTMRYLYEYQEAIVVSPQQSSKLPAASVPPAGSLYKVNVDGAVFSAQKEAVVGVIIRDDKGLVVAALSRKICAPLGALEVEAKVFEAGHQLAKYVGIHNLILEVDSLTVYFALTFPYFSGFFYLRYGGRLLMIFVLLCFLRYVGKVI